MLMTVIALRLLGWDLLWGAGFTQQVLALLEAVPGAKPHITQFLPASWWSCVTRDFHMVKRPSGTTSFSQWIELNRHRKLTILELSKPHNNYCGVLDGDRNGCRPSQSCPSSPSHILDFAWPWSWVCRIVLYLWRAAEPLWPSPLLNLRGPTVHKNLYVFSSSAQPLRLHQQPSQAPQPVQPAPQLSHSCPEAFEICPRSPWTPEHPPSSWCECHLQQWLTLTYLPRWQQGPQAASSCYSKQKISRRKVGLLDAQFPLSPKLNN